MTIESELARIGDLLEKLLASNSGSSTTTKKTRTKATSSSTPVESAATEAASSTSAEATSEAPPSEAAPEAPAPSKSNGSGTSPASSTAIPSLDDVRAALTKCQARNKGDLAVPRAILGKYAKTSTLGSLKDEDRAKVISECNAA